MRHVRAGLVVLVAVVSVSVVNQQARGQEALTPLANTTVDHVGIVVADIDKVIASFQDIFGVTVPAAREVGPLALKGNVPNAAASRIKFTNLAIGDLGIELMQPVAGPGPHRDHFDKFGQGMHHVGFLIKDQQKSIDYLVAKGGTWTNANHVNMREILGMTVESKVQDPRAATPRPAVSPTPGKPMSNAVVAHIGIVVRDIDKTSRTFEEIFGITVPKASEAGPIPFGANPPPNADKQRIRYCFFKIGTMTFELIQPTAGPGPLRDHLDKFGQGLHHLAFSVKDSKSSIDYLVSRGGTWTIVPYVDMKDILGFTAEMAAAP
jgi:catechol 2,3-dioxygenase-like lactoylglutathione lyase family enzyme